MTKQAKTRINSVGGGGSHAVTILLQACAGLAAKPIITGAYSASASLFYIDQFLDFSRGL